MSEIKFLYDSFANQFKNNNRSGLFVVLEGTDRAGKTTQVNLLKEKFKDAHFFKFPQRNQPNNPIGDIINTYLKNSAVKLDDHAIHLLFSADRWQTNDKLKELLSRGSLVIADRYSHSGIAYSMAKGLDQEWCTSCDACLEQPDIIV